MKQLLLFGLLCAVAPWVLSRMHFIFGGFTRSLVYLLALGQILIVPVLVAVDPDISFGSDAYSLGAGVGIILITTIEFVFVLGTVLGLLAAVSYINRRERAADAVRVAAMFSAEPAKEFPAAPAGIPESKASAYTARANIESTDLPPSHIVVPSVDPQTAATPDRESVARRPSVGLIIVGAYLCSVLAFSGTQILIEGLSTGSYGWIRNFGAVSLADRPISFAIVTIMFLLPTVAAGWGFISLLSRIWRKYQGSASRGRSSGR